jgi:hypothetical protein
MNKFWALMFALGSFAFFGLSQQYSRVVQDHSRYGEPVGQPRIVGITDGERTAYQVLGIISILACVYFIARVRGDDTRK